MNRIKQLTDQRAAKVAEWKQAAEAGDEARCTALKAEVETFGKQIKDAVSTAAQIEAAEAEGAELEARAKAPTTEAERSSKPGIEVGESREQELPFGQFLNLIRCARQKGGSFQERLDKIQRRHAAKFPTEQRAAADGASANDPADGSVMIAQEVYPGIYQRMHEMGFLLPAGGALAAAAPGSYARPWRIPVGAKANGVKIPYVDETTRATGAQMGGVLAYYADEVEAVDEKKPKFGMMEMGLTTITALGYINDEMLEDLDTMGAIMSEAAAKALTFKGENGLINGLGAKQQLGILKAPCLVTIDAETDQDADTINAKNLMKMWAAAWAPGRPRSAWLINQEIEPQLMQAGIEIGTAGYPVYMPPGGISVAPYGTLFGRPVIPTEYCAALGDKGDIILADLSEVVFIEQGGIKTASSIHVKFEERQTAFRFVWRLNSQPTWRTSLTPYKGAQKLSPFVTLAARA